MALNDDGTVLFVGYIVDRCVVAYDVENLQLMWMTNQSVKSILHYDGLLLVTSGSVPLTVLRASDGCVVTTLDVANEDTMGHSVFAGL